jgi:hypothetical protein
MHSTRRKPPEIALVIVAAAFVLTLAAPQALIAQCSIQTVETLQTVSGSCAEQYRLACEAWPLAASLAVANQYGPVTYSAHGPQPEETARVELQVPTALLRNLWMVEGSRGIIELHVPAVLLATMAAEGQLQTPPRSADLCTPFCSSY